MSEVIIHLHAGPLAGTYWTTDRHSVSLVPGIGIPDLHLDHPAAGSYVRDESSAGGRCYDWKES